MATKTPENHPSREGLSDALVLPDWVEEAVFLDFLATQPLVLEELETDILSLESGEADALDAFKRRVHTMKGEAGVLGLLAYQEVCHGVEDFLVASASVGPDEVDRLFGAHDWLAHALSSYRTRRLPLPSSQEFIESLLPTNAETLDSSPTTATFEAVENTGASTASPDGALCAEGQLLQDAYLGLSEAERVLIEIEMSGPSGAALGALANVFRSVQGMAELFQLEAAHSLASATISFLDACKSGVPRLEGAALDLLFDLANALTSEVGAKLGLEQRPGPQPSKLLERLEMASHGNLPVEEQIALANIEDKTGEILLQHGKLNEDDLKAALATQRESGRKLGEELILMGAVHPKDVAHALRARKRAERRASNLAPVEIRETVKVTTERVDELIEILGELVISQSILTDAPEVRKLSGTRVQGALLRVTKLTKDLQDVGMRMRMVPVRGLFQKMNRATRELSRKLGRDILLATEGADTEIDRSMVERLSDPLLHMIRNAVDHGIEPPDKRREAGKPLRGTIHLRARAEGGSIVIEVSDDGGGLDVDRILKKAINLGIVESEETLNAGQVNKLIFAPGFTTAEKVSDVSGRGVGMDVVRRHIEAMRGRVSVSSERSRGTTFTITLPLTLAVIDGTLLWADGERYIIPTLSIVESFDGRQRRTHELGNGARILDLGDQSVPLVSLSDLIGGPQGRKRRGSEHVILIETLGHRLGLQVDDIDGHQQVVIKNLGAYFQEDRFLAGAAILPDGEVGLILNVDELATLVDEVPCRKKTASDRARGASRVESPRTENVEPMQRW